MRRYKDTTTNIWHVLTMHKPPFKCFISGPLFCTTD